MGKKRKYKTGKKRSGGSVAMAVVLIGSLAVLALAVGLLWPQLGDILGAPQPDDSSAPQSSPGTTTTTTPSVAGYYVTTDALNMRSGPGTEYEVLGVLEAGKAVEVLGAEGGWYRISLMGQTAYISAEYVVPSTAAPSTTTTATQAGTTTSPQYSDRYIDGDGMLQFDPAGRYVQAASYPDGAEIPWALLLVNDWNPMKEGYDESVTMKSVESKYAQVNSGQKVDARMYDDLIAMLEAGKAHNIGVQSSYRAYSHQKRLYWKKVEELKRRYSDPIVLQTKAGEEVKRPGFSEHNSGLAVDLYGSGNTLLNESFANTAAYAWLIEHCADYGFILRFPKGKEAVTGVVYEAWHFRYVGDPAVAHAIMDNGLCLEEYLEQNRK